jgi:hypothetical protein
MRLIAFPRQHFRARTANVLSTWLFHRSPFIPWYKCADFARYRCFHKSCSLSLHCPAQEADLLILSTIASTYFSCLRYTWPFTLRFSALSKVTFCSVHSFILLISCSGHPSGAFYSQHWHSYFVGHNGHSHFHDAQYRWYATRRHCIRFFMTFLRDLFADFCIFLFRRSYVLLLFSNRDTYFKSEQ